jgi:hypothetical protein
MKIELTPEDHCEARRRAAFFVNRVLANQYRAITLESRVRSEMMQRDILGALGQCVIAKAFAMEWLFDINGFKHPDVGPFWVRTTDRENGSLIYRSPDTAENEPWVLAYVPSLDATFGLVRGWCYGREAKRGLYWRTDVRSPAWFVPHRSLRKLDDPEFRQFLRGVQQPLF